MGTSIDKLGGENSDRDHPHAYGDKGQDLAMLLLRKGSSPRVWGQDRNFRCKRKPTGIIPTRMGTRLPFQAVKTRGRDHPHAYGDKLFDCGRMLKLLGSSPRVWGQVTDLVYSIDSERIIPTRMGTSL